MISEEIKKLDIFQKGRLEKILDLDFMSEEMLESLIEAYPPFTRKLTGNAQDLTAWYQTDWINAHPTQKHQKENGYLVALYRLADQRQKGHSCWLCWNIRTNDIYGNVLGYNFVSGHANGSEDKPREPWSKRYHARKDHYVDLSGQKFGYIQVIKPTGNRQVGDARREWLCHCEACKKNFTKDSHTLPKMLHCGCLKPYSNDVIMIRKMLDDNSIKYKQEYTFNDCRDVSPLPFDFAIEDKNGRAYLLEYDGEQHFKSVAHWGGIEKVRQHDLVKNHYCFNNNIRLLRIPVGEEYTLEDILLKTNKFLLTPENENEYYVKRSAI